MKHIFIKKKISSYLTNYGKYIFSYFVIFLSMTFLFREQVNVLESYHNILSYACLGSVAGTVGFLVVDNM